MDSLADNAPYNNDQGLDPSFQVRPNGVLYVFTSLSGNGSRPPLGTASADSADRMGYFRSTNGGTTWTWTTVALDGQALDPTDTADYFIPENFGQIDGVVDASGVIHMVFNGYAIHQRAPDTTTVVKLMYWNSSSNTFRNISRSAETHNYDPALRSGNALGRVYPTISYDPTTNVLFSAWSEPQISGAQQDTANGVQLYDVWYAWSNDGGATWTAATNLTQTPTATELFTSSDRWLTQTPTAASDQSLTHNRRAHFLYLSETAANTGCFVFGEGPRSQSAWIYRTLDRLVTSVGDDANQPLAFSLKQNYPNPFNPSTKIQYSITKNSFVTLKVYDILGRDVATLVNQDQPAGDYTVNFDALDVSNGTYFYRIQAGSFTDVKKMMVLK